MHQAIDAMSDVVSGHSYSSSCLLSCRFVKWGGNHAHLQTSTSQINAALSFASCHLTKWMVRTRRWTQGGGHAE